MSPKNTAWLLAFAALPSVVRSTSYTLSNSYSGSNFFSQFNFTTAVDKNYGNAAFQNAQVAASQKLAYINSAGNAIIKIDNTTVGNPADNSFGRASVSLISNAAINPGSLVLVDMLHAPAGCSVWPGIWLQGAGVEWPQHGEIDIFENVNNATSNQYSLHTLNGCMHPNSNTGETGTLVSTNCYNGTDSNQGCVVKEAQANSFGNPFNTNGGGAFATAFNDTGIMTWFFPSSKIPSDFSSSSPNPDQWGVPSAFYPASTCNVTEFFGPQNIYIYLNICGAFAIGAFAETCGTGSCLDLVRNPRNYDDAYFEIKSLRVFSQSGSANSPTPSGSSPSTSPTQSSGQSGGAVLKFSADQPTGLAALLGLSSVTLVGVLASFGLLF